MERAERPRRPVNGTTIVAGILYIVLGGLFLLERAGLFTLGPQLVVPVLLIGLGAAVLAGARRRRPPAAAPQPKEPDEPRDPFESPSE